ncbi:MAG: radical SAM peptide maturase, CXXX-repeat target family [Lachnospirales bacterium]
MALIDLDSVLENSFGNKNVAHITWEKGNYLNATFCVTEECNLECTYCYMVGKNNFRKMSFDTAKKIVDYLINDPYCVELTDNLMVDFIGGEPLLEMELIDKISDYIVLSLYVKDHKWFDNFQISFSTNGTLYDTPEVELYLKKHRDHCGFGFSIDGNKEKHDLTRKTRGGQGSYDQVIKSFEKFKEDFGDEIYQKSTFSSDDLMYLKDSIIHLWDLGFKEVESNLVYEDVWKPEDPQLFENQLKELADYMFESGRYLTHSVAYFEKRRGLPLSTNSLNQNRCGAGYKSLAFDCDGNIYPCIRFLDMCSEDKVSKTVGHITTGVNYNSLRALCGTTWNAVSNDECSSCSVGTDCGWCVAQNYQEKGSLYKRVTSICEMHKANARANKYFWTKFEKLTGRTSERIIEKVLNSHHDQLKYVYFITSDDAPAFCGYDKKYSGNNKMSEDLYRQGLEFCLENEVLPIFLGNRPIDIDLTLI